ncbi:uncharacterized protein DFL_003739 [Arthrobotrys flagrans]|uniref:Blue (type 1) copper domain-containing protein n=1 Tax=Arthrobotrys flagrans TaxID=97331 RepID=A0A437A2P2_ARTFL|nr:hypothetical protein DFL_003739 [Arthrobotrys flagrans]
MRFQLALVAGLLSTSALAYGDEDWGNRAPKAKTVTKVITKTYTKTYTKTCTVTKLKNVIKTRTEVKTVTVTAAAGKDGEDAVTKEDEPNKDYEKEEKPAKAAEKPAKTEDEEGDKEEGDKEEGDKEEGDKEEGDKEEPAADEAKPAPKTHIIKAKTDDDGNDVFEPATLKAATGDTVVFEFHPSTHSVARGTFDKPCQPLEKGGFYSGFLRVSGDAKSPTFTIKVEDSNPIWYYCTVGKHCQGGMVGVINPGPKDDLKAYIAASKKADSNVSPKEVNGGTVANPKFRRIIRA